MQRIPLKNRAGEVVDHALVSDEDYAELSQHKWSLDGRGYVQRAATWNGRKTVFTMHREVMRLPRGDERMVDHINRVRTDNRRENLRYATASINKQNGNAHRDSTSRYVGVSWDKRRQKWVGAVCVNGKRIFVKRFDREIDAARARHAVCVEHMPGYVGDPLLD